MRGQKGKQRSRGAAISRGRESRASPSMPAAAAADRSAAVRTAWAPARGDQKSLTATGRDGSAILEMGCSTKRGLGRAHVSSKYHSRTMPRVRGSEMWAWSLAMTSPSMYLGSARHPYLRKKGGGARLGDVSEGSAQTGTQPPALLREGTGPPKRNRARMLALARGSNKQISSKRRASGR